MKKFYALALALMSFMAMSAQEFVVNHAGQAIKNGETIIVSEPHNTTIGAIGTKYEFNSDLTFVGESEGNVVVTGKLVGDIKDDSGLMIFTLCPSTCTYLENGVITNTFAYTPDKGSFDLQLHFGATSFVKNVEQPIVYAELDMTIQYDDADETALKFKLIISNDPDASVSSIATDNNGIRFANNALTLSLAKASSLEVFGATGARVKYVANVQNGTVDLSSLPTGIYFYRVAGKSGRIVIRK
jgi:hypothetical protein